MFEPVSIVRLLTYAALAVVAGAALFRALDARFASHRRLQVLGYGAVAILAIAQLVLIAMQGGETTVEDLARSSLAFATASWTGELLGLRAIVAVATAVMIGTVVWQWRRACLALVVLNLLLVPLSGHAASASPFLASSILHAVHVAAAIVWLGALLWFAAIWLKGFQPFRLVTFNAQLRLFSPVALWLVSLAVLTGILAAVLQTGRPAALFGTAYGQLLLFKGCLFLPIALACAAWLRFAYLGGSSRRSPLVALIMEAAAVAAMCIVAAILSQGVPGRHDDIVWPFSFRFDVAKLWNDPQASATMFWLFALAGVALVVAAYLATRRDWPRAFVAICGAAIIPLFGLVQVSVPAFPTSFAVSSSRYAATNLSNADRLFQKNCAYCHGQTGRGDGPVIEQLEFANADLTAPHTKSHTDGDLYWWITHGTPSGQMPDFEQEIDDDGRWDLVNYVRFLTNARESERLGSEIEPHKPWLPAIDFDYLDADGTARSLRDLSPTSPVLLVIGTEPASLTRLGQLRQELQLLKAASLTLIFVCGPEIASNCKEDTSDPTLKVLTSNVDELIWAWTGYRRTLAHPDASDVETKVSHLEFLIDRFGYVRARWRGDEPTLAAVGDIVRQARLLAAEPEILVPAGQHSH